MSSSTQQMGDTSEDEGRVDAEDDVGGSVGVQQSAVQKFYAGGVVFVTGATGFMGKVLVEKLLWSCPDVDAIYVLVRSKKGKTGQQRIGDLVGSPCFDRLRRERGLGFKAKLLAVQGDITEEGLGMRAHDCQLLAERVTVVFHVAATVRFDEQLNQAVKQNVRGTRDVLALCRTFTQLKAVVHVSTAYANCPYEDIEERFYESPLDCDQAIEMAATIDDDTMTSMTEKVLGVWPNSYTFTKALAEQVIRKHGQGLPVAILRPGIVVCSVEEPACGWIDSTYGPTGLLLGTALGILRTASTDGSALANIVPCDMAINAVIVAAWDVAGNSLASSDTPIYNFVPLRANTITWDKYHELYYKQILRLPVLSGVWYPFGILAKPAAMIFVLRLMLHILPALLVDAYLQMNGKPPKMCKTYRKIHKNLDVIKPFSNGLWRFEERNVSALWALASARDKALFPFDMRSLDWTDFALRTYPGMRKFVMNEDDATIPLARTKLRRLYWINCLVVIGAVVLLSWALFNIFQSVVLPVFSPGPLGWVHRRPAN